MTCKMTIEARILNACAEGFVDQVLTIARIVFDGDASTGWSAGCVEGKRRLHNYQTTRRALHKLVDSGLIFKALGGRGYISMLPAHVKQRLSIMQKDADDAGVIRHAMRQLGFLKAAPDPVDFEDEDDYDEACGDVEFANNRKVGYGRELTLTNEEFLKLARMAGVING